MKIICNWVLVILTFFGLAASAEYLTVGEKRVWAGYADAKVTLRVVDSEGLPVADAKVNAGLFDSKYQDVRNLFAGSTDSNGCFVIEGATSLDVEYVIEKPGFYDSRGIYSFKKSAPAGEQAVVGGKWQPWDPKCQIMLKNVRKPIPMYAKNVETICPESEKPIGYDLVIGDWIAPYGQGRTADLIFTVQGSFVSASDRSARMTLEFSNPYDGIREFVSETDRGRDVSKFISPYEAPEDGYTSRRTFEKRLAPMLDERINATPREDLNFFVRVRTKVDEYGKILCATYGKIQGDIRCDFRDFSNPTDIGVSFTYYLNPAPNDRNIEFDPKQNIFTDLAPMEQVNEP